MTLGDCTFSLITERIIDHKGGEMSNELPISQKEDTKVSSLISHYKLLVEHVDQKIYPSFEHPPFIAIPEMGHWPKWCSALYKYSMPLLFLAQSEAGGSSTLLYFIGAFAFGIWSSVSVRLFNWIFRTQTPTVAVNISLWYENIIPGVILLVGIFFSLGIYFHSVLFLINNKNDLKVRLVWLSILAISVLYIALVMKNEYPNTFPNALIDLRLRNIFIFTILVFALPAIIYFATFIVIGTRFFLWLIKFSLNYFFSTHNPYTYVKIPDVLFDSVVQGEQKWDMLDLTSRELKTLREWSRDNLEAIEKRLIPSFWILALLGIFANTFIFEDWLRGWIRYFSDKHDLLTNNNAILTDQLWPLIIFYVLVPLTIGLLMVITSRYILIFRNIAVQIVLIDACTISIYAIEQRDETSKSEAVQQERKTKSFWSKLFG